MNPFDEEEKIYMVFEIRGHGKESIFRAEYDDCVPWTELLDDCVKQLEANYGYCFDIPLEIEKGLLGVYYTDKKLEGE